MTTEAQPDAASPASQASLAYDRLLEVVVSLDLRPGSYVSESELSELVGVGRTPVREAVQRLSIEEFCEVLPRRGILIVPLDLDRQIDIHEIRLELEPAAARMAAERITEAESKRLEELLAGGAADALEDDDTATIDEQLHRSVAQASKNELLMRTLAPLYAHSRRHWNNQRRRGLKDPTAILGEWKHILKAIRGGDGGAAYKHMRAHVEAARASLLSQ